MTDFSLFVVLLPNLSLLVVVWLIHVYRCLCVPVAIWLVALSFPDRKGQGRGLLSRNRKVWVGKNVFVRLIEVFVRIQDQSHNCSNQSGHCLKMIGPGAHAFSFLFYFWVLEPPFP